MAPWGSLRSAYGLRARSGVPAGTLGWWSAKLRRQRASRSHVEFIELKVSDVVPVPSAKVEIVTRSERRIVVDLDAKPEHVARLVAEFERC